MAHFRTSLHKSHGLFALGILLCPVPDTTLNNPGHRDDAHHILPYGLCGEGIHEEQTTFQIECAVHGA